MQVHMHGHMHVRMHGHMHVHTFMRIRACMCTWLKQALTYIVHLDRSSFYYVNFALLPSIVLTVLSFAVFFMSFKVGERLSYGITIILAIEVNRMTLAGMIPICGELLWIELFFWVSGCVSKQASR